MYVCTINFVWHLDYNTNNIYVCIGFCRPTTLYCNNTHNTTQHWQHNTIKNNTLRTAKKEGINTTPSI